MEGACTDSTEATQDSIPLSTNTEAELMMEYCLAWPQC